jgi:hypothetical protein
MRIFAARLSAVTPPFRRRRVSPSNDLSEKHLPSQKEKIDAFMVWSSQETLSITGAWRGRGEPKHMDKKRDLSRMVA